MLDEWVNLNTSLKDDWVSYINSFQSTKNNFPGNSFVDDNYIKFFNEGINIRSLKYFTKDVLNYFGFNYESKEIYLNSSIRARNKTSNINFKPN